MAVINSRGIQGAVAIRRHLHPCASATMPRRTPGKPLLISLSTRGSIAPTWYAQHAAADAGLGALDLDATTSFSHWLSGRFAGEEQQYVPVRSIWVPADHVQLERTRELVSKIATRQPASPPGVVALLPVSYALRDVMKLATTAYANQETYQIVIGVPSGSLRGGRSHLVQLGGVRRLLEEWEVPLALDLSGRFDPTWEAEAAIARLGSQLQFLRMRVSAATPAAVGADRVACRTLLAALDRGWITDLAFSTAGSRILPPFLSSQGANAYRNAIEFVRQRQLSHFEALRQGIGHVEGSPSSRNL